MKDAIQKCRFCGKPIAVITYGIYRKSVVDADPVWVSADQSGVDYVRIDGSKIRGREVDVTAPVKSEPAYRIHGRSCGRRPS